MIEMSLTTPGLLFPAISLLLLAYTNRFVVLTKVIRELGQLHDDAHFDLIRRQIDNLRARIHMIRGMQTLGVLSFCFCTISMLCLFFGWQGAGEIIFGMALVLLTFSLLVSLAEVQISTRAITIEIERLGRACTN